MMKRTVLLATPYFPPNFGGVEMYTWYLAQQLRDRHGYRVVVATTADTEKPGLGEGPGGIPVYRLPTHLRISRTPIGLRWRQSLREIIQAEQVDLVNAHAPVPLFADAAARACGNLPFVLTYHSGRMRKRNPISSMLCAVYEHTVLASTVRRAQEIVCCSDYVRADLAHLFAGRSTTICPGVDLVRFAASPVPIERRIVFAASLEHATAYKGLPDLLVALARLIRTVPGVLLEVVGSGSAAADYEQLAHRLGIADRVVFAGRLDGDDLAQAYRRARVFCLPTHCESFGTVLVEAMASGRPVISTRVGGVPSLVTEGVHGLLVEPGDITGLTQALSDVLSDHSLAEQFGEAGRKHVATELAWERQADRTAKVFARALGMTDAQDTESLCTPIRTAQPSVQRIPAMTSRSATRAGLAVPSTR
jgi:glycosyltransferase involved in cell wall biosynthesis